MGILARVFGVDFKQPGWNLRSSVFGFGELPMTLAMIVGYLFVFVGATMLVEGWRELYTARKENRLARSGLYGIVRQRRRLRQEAGSAAVRLRNGSCPPGSMG